MINTNTLDSPETESVYLTDLCSEAGYACLMDLRSAAGRAYLRNLLSKIETGCSANFRSETGKYRLDCFADVEFVDM